MDDDLLVCSRESKRRPFCIAWPMTRSPAVFLVSFAAFSSFAATRLSFISKYDGKAVQIYMRTLVQGCTGVQEYKYRKEIQERNGKVLTFVGTSSPIPV